MVTINKQWIIKQLFYGTTATQFTYNTNNQIKPTVPVYGNQKLKLNQACIAMQQQGKEYIYRKQNSPPPQDSYQKICSHIDVFIFFNLPFSNKKKITVR